MSVAVEQLQSLARVAQADAAVRGMERHRAAGAVVADLEVKLSSMLAGGDADAGRSRPLANPVPHGVLDQRLEQQVRDQRVLGARLDRHLQLQALTEAGFLDRYVVAQERQLVGEAVDGRSLGGEQAPEEP